MPRIEAYAYSPGSNATTHRSVCLLGIEEQPSSPTVTYAQLAAPAVFSDALTEWKAYFDLHTPAGLYSITYSSTTRRVTIASTNGTSFKPIFSGNLATFLGFGSGPFAFATSHTGTAIPAGVMELIGAECEAPEDATDLDALRLRHGRAYVCAFGNHMVQRIGLLCLSAYAPSTLAYISTGKVRVYVTSDSNPYSVSNLDGYVEGHVIDHEGFDVLGNAAELTELRLTLAVGG